MSRPATGAAALAYPQRLARDGAEGRDPLQGLAEAWRRITGRLTPCRPRPLPFEAEAALARSLRRAQRLEAGELQAAAGSVAHRLRSRGFTPESSAAALAVAMRAMQLGRGLSAYDTQLQAAWWMLQGHLVEMATGEGKTVAIALAAGAAALGGEPVHVITANDYLVRRDAEAMAPHYAALGLRVDRVDSRTPAAERAARWRQAVVYTTARELAFDYLRDHVAQGGERDPRLQRAQALAAAEAGAEARRDAAPGARPEGPGSTLPDAAPLLPGLHWALIDEADSVLLDEAVVPLILAHSAPATEAESLAWRRAWEFSQRLLRGRHYQLRPEQRRAELTPEGRQAVARAVKRLGDEAGPFGPPRRGCELVAAALAARHVLRRDHDYVLRPDPATPQQPPQVQLIDALTGRIAEGRQWQGVLQPMVQLKEGLLPGHPSRTTAQITYQRFFPRYLRLGGMSGTLIEARHELLRLYRVPVLPVPRHKPSRFAWAGEAVWADQRAKWAAVLKAVRREHRAGRPVLVGTDSVAEARQLSLLLDKARLPHQLLDARQDADEALLVARAGEAGRITVATNMAGRGTDIQPDAPALAAGGLHVIACMRNRARRIDRQLTGRAARQGEPGSAEAIVALDDALPAARLPAALRRWLTGLARRRRGRLPAALGGAAMALAQRLAEAEDAERRTRLQRAERMDGALYGLAGPLE